MQYGTLVGSSWVIIKLLVPSSGHRGLEIIVVLEVIGFEIEDLARFLSKFIDS